MLEESAALWRQVGDTIHLGQVLVMLGQVAAARGDLEAAGQQLRQALRLFADANVGLEVAETLEAFAATCAAADPEPMVRLVASATVIREAIGAPIQPVERARLEPQLAIARVRLGEQAYGTAWQRGRAMQMADAIDEVLAPRR